MRQGPRWLDLRGPKSLSRAAKIQRVSGLPDVGYDLDGPSRMPPQADGLVGGTHFVVSDRVASASGGAGCARPVGKAKDPGAVNLPKRCPVTRRLKAAAVILRLAKIVSESQKA